LCNQNYKHLVPETFTHLGVYSDLVDAIRKESTTYPLAPPGEATRRMIREVLGFSSLDTSPKDVSIDARWQGDGVAGEEVSWSTGYGPRTRALVLKPAGAERLLPGIVALHGHDGMKFFGKEKIADGREVTPIEVKTLRADLYEGRSFANDLCKQGFIVLVHDVFLWGSRRFPYEVMPETVHRLVDNWLAVQTRRGPQPGEAELYDIAAQYHEHLVAKYCSVLGVSLAGIVNFEDRVAAKYLRSRPDVCLGPIGCIGLSGGGCRAALLQATCDHIGAAAIVGMMSTYHELLDHQVDCHTWMFFPPGIARVADWPDVAACRAPSPVLVQYDRHDHLFPIKGMEAAHQRIAFHYEKAGHRDAYLGLFYDGPHKFDAAMQADAFAWLRTQLPVQSSP
jgi:dienelactone hydrolase